MKYKGFRSCKWTLNRTSRLKPLFASPFLLSSDEIIINFENHDFQEIPIGNWVLVRKVGDVDIAFKFAKSFKLPPNETTTVWSSGENKKNEPPLTIAMKNQKWTIGDVMETLLQNKEGDVRPTFTHSTRCTFYSIFLKRLMLRC